MAQFAPETFMLKVSPKNNGQHLVPATEDLGKGDPTCFGVRLRLGVAVSPSEDARRALCL
jgi:hypothetical protein